MADVLNSYVDQLCRAIVHSPLLRTNGPSTHYRNKVSYSLEAEVALQTSELALDSVNRLAHHVDSFRREHSRFARTQFWAEVCIKETRDAKFAIKLVFRNCALTGENKIAAEPCISLATTANADGTHLVIPRGAKRPRDDGERYSTAFSWWAAHEAPQLIAHLHECGYGASLASVVAQVDLDPSKVNANDAASRRKPAKDAAYVPLCDYPAQVTEYTPNQVPFALSADAFCEVNHFMEDAMYDVTVDFLRLGTNQELRVPRGAFFTGRDINCVWRTYQAFYDVVIPVTTCPRVFSDAVNSNLTGADCKFVSKDQVGTVALQAIPQAFHELRTRATSPSAPLEFHVMLTAGRHGLHDSACAALATMAGQPVTDLVYVSCNVESMSRDMTILRQTYGIANCRSFDFFPGTDYVMTILHLQPLRSSYARCVPSRLVVLPVGAPGVGKSTSARYLRDNVFCLCDTDPTRGSTENAKSVSRSQMRIGNANECVYVFERDAAFAAQRVVASTTLAQTKAAVHAQLMSALRFELGDKKMSPQPTILIVDSTNGSREARSTYAEICRAAEPQHSTQVLEIFFTSPATSELIERVAGRRDHPSFPQSIQDRVAKIERIQCAIEWCDGDVPCERNLPSDTKPLRVQVRPCESETALLRLVGWFVVVARYCSVQVASALIQQDQCE